MRHVLGIAGALVLAISLTLVLDVKNEGLLTHTFLQPAPVEILFAGDMMFDRSIRTYMREYGDDHVFSCIDETLNSADLVVANLEGPITDNPSVSEYTEPGSEYNFTFTFDPKVAPLLKAHNIGLVNLGNNHIMNFSLEGLNETKQYLEAVGVQYFGDPDALEDQKVARLELKGIPLSFVNLSDWNSDKTDHTVAQVLKEVEQGRVTIVYAHWGEEYEEPLPRVRVLAHEFIQAGASLVVGSHPHIVQEKEEYMGKYIYYSLGNFIFDQYFSSSVRTGLLLRVRVEESGITKIEELPIELKRDRTVCLLQ